MLSAHFADSMWVHAANIAGYLAVLLVAMPTLLLLVEAIASIRNRIPAAPRAMSDAPSEYTPEPRAFDLIVLMPAHDEANGIQSSIVAIRRQLQPNDRVLVVADNCSDETATLAAGAGAQVVERRDELRRGKGFALDHGVRYIESRGWTPGVVIVIDADCHPQAEMIERVARAAFTSDRVAQARNLMIAPSKEEATSGMAVAEFAFRIKNWVRPRGLQQLGLPVPLQGTGVAYPWTVLRSAPLATANIVEDMALGVELSTTLHAPAFVEDALILSEFPSTVAGQERQHRRWEHGHLQTIARFVPILLKASIENRRPALLLSALDLAIPPLSLLGISFFALFAFTASLALVGASPIPLVLACLICAAGAAAILLAWFRFGRDLLPLRSLPIRILGYAARKLPLYGQFAFERHREWNRAERTGD